MKEQKGFSIDVAYGDSCPAGLPVTLGAPLPEGLMTKAGRVNVTAPSGESRPGWCRPFVHWPDGSGRWGLLSFGAREPGEHRVTFDGASVEPPEPVTLTQQDDKWTISNGRLSVTLGETGPGPIHRVDRDGHTYLDDPAKLAFCVNAASTRAESQRSIRVLEESPLRARLRVEGAHFTGDGKQQLTYRLDVELWTGWPTLRLDYQFFNLEAGQASTNIHRLACETEWELSGETERHFLQENYGLFYVSRHVFNPNRVAIMCDEVRDVAYVEDPAMLLDDIDYPFYLHAPLVRTRNWLGVHGDGRAVYMQMQDFGLMRPTRMTSEGAQLNLEIWPSTKEQLELPQGRSRRQSILLSFMPSDNALPEKRTGKMPGAPIQAPQGVAATLGALMYEERACVDPAWIAHCGEFEQDLAVPVGKHLRFEQSLRSCLRMEMPNTKFDVGDTDTNDGYKTWYSVTGEDRVRPLPGFPNIPRYWPTGLPTQTYLDCHEPVWLNNEYDSIHTFCSELMRTGRFELWRQVRLTVRHNIEVDFLHYSDHKWLHHTTPAHSARHGTTGAYPSHFWTQGLLEYYCLTGDPDALEVALALGDKTIEFFDSPEQREVLWGFNREIGWSILLLAHLYDVTREERFRPLLDELVDFIIGYDRAAFTGAVNLSSGNDRMTLDRQIIAGLFGYVSMVDGVDRYATVTGRADVADWLKTFTADLVTAAIEAIRDGEGLGLRFGIVLAVGYERSGDERFMKFTEVWLDNLCWDTKGPTGAPRDYRGWPRILGHAWRLGRLDQYELPGMRRLKEIE